MRIQKINCAVSRAKAILTRCPPSYSTPPPLFSTVMVCRQSVALLVRKLLRTKSCNLEHAVSLESTQSYPPWHQPRPPTAKDDTQHSSWSGVCVCVCECVCRCLCVSAVWTNISNWAINHCSSRSFNLVEAWVWGRLTVRLLLTVELYLEVLGGELIQHVAWEDSQSACVLTHTVWRSVEQGVKNKMQEEDTRTTGGEKKRDLPPCLPISKGHPAFPLPLMQRFQGNGLMGKTTTAWLILAPESLAEWIWKSEYDPISAHIPVSDSNTHTERERAKQSGQRWRII